MKHSLYIKLLAATALVGSAAPGCIDETFPDSNYVTESMLDSSNPTIVAGFANAIVSEMAKCSRYYSSCYFDLGYPGICHINDIYCSDFPIYDNSYDYFYYHSADLYMGEYATNEIFWNRYYSYIKLCNNMLALEYSDASAKYFSMAHFYRALFYFDLARYLEYKPTGWAAKDDLAASRNLHGLTCPIVTEATTEADASYLPRAPYAEMYKFILSDVARAEEIIDGATPEEKHLPSAACAKGLEAKIWLEIASHMDQYPEDLADFDPQTSVQALYKKAYDCADEAIRLHPGAPLTESEWYGGSNYGDGFNNMQMGSWMLGLTISKDLIQASWFNIVSYLSPETLYGIAGVLEENGKYTKTYTAQRMIGAELYSKISNSDWRKRTWISPDDAGKASAVSNYPTKIPGAWFAQLPAYCGFKFRPAGGNQSDYSVGCAVDFPLMRVEEMYFVRAEAAANCQGVGAGISLLQDFMNTYRYTDGSYFCNASDVNGFVEELMRQKRIEFWGEGVVAHDYKRLNLKVVRAYDNTNFVDSYAFNSIAGKCAPWLNGYILRSEVGRNSALVQNPDPSVDEGNRVYN